MKKEDMIRRAIGGIDDKLVDGAKASPSLKKRPLWIKYGTVAAAVLLFVSVVVAVPFAVNKGENRPAIPVESNVIPAESDKITNPMATIMQTDPIATDKTVKIIYSNKEEFVKSSLTNTSWETGLSAGLVTFEYSLEREAFENEEDEDTLFYVLFDTWYGGPSKQTKISLKDFYDNNGNFDERGYYEAVKEERKNVLIEEFDKAGIALKYQDEEDYVGYITKSDVEKMKGFVSGFLYMLPKEFSYENWHESFCSTLPDGAKEYHRLRY